MPNNESISNRYQPVGTTSATGIKPLQTSVKLLQCALGRVTQQCSLVILPTWRVDTIHWIVERLSERAPVRWLDRIPDSPSPVRIVLPPRLACAPKISISAYSVKYWPIRGIIKIIICAPQWINRVPIVSHGPIYQWYIINAFESLLTLPADGLPFFSRFLSSSADRRSQDRPENPRNHFRFRLTSSNRKAKFFQIDFSLIKYPASYVRATASAPIESWRALFRVD